MACLLKGKTMDHSHSNQLEEASWANSDHFNSQEEFLTGWLANLCSQIEGVNEGLLLVASAQENTFVPGAVWPADTRDLSFLGTVAQQALVERKGVVQERMSDPTDPNHQSSCVAYPIAVKGELKGAVVLNLTPRPDQQLRDVLKDIHWGAAWLVNLFIQQPQHDQERKLTQMALVNALLANALQENRVKSCAMVVVNDLAQRLSCDRVSLGLEQSGMIEIEAISNTANFDRKANLTRTIADAMDEVLDTGESLTFPAFGDDALVSAAQAALATESGALGVISVPLVNDGRDIGVLTLERNSGIAFDAVDINTCKVLGTLLGAVVALKRDNEKGVLRRSWQAIRGGMRALYAPGHHGAKLMALLVFVAVLLLGLVKGEYRVSAKTVVEGAIQRATAAPFDGFIVETFVQAGDIVRKDQVMARLEDRDMKVELAKWTAENEQYLRKYRQAQANRDRASMGILYAQAEQSAAQVELIEKKLSRTRLLAPYDGVVVSGDLRQLVGTPIEMGKVLFETAPLDTFRVILQIDEREIGYLTSGQRGSLLLSGIPGEHFNFTVNQITPVAVAQDGRNFFRVEAKINGDVARLRPGMEGVGKVSVGRYRMIWIWTHSLTEWFTITFWKWTL